MADIYDKRIALMKKYEEGTEPSPKEIQEAYSYLDSCLSCGKKFIFWSA